MPADAHCTDELKNITEPLSQIFAAIQKVDPHVWSIFLGHSTKTLKKLDKLLLSSSPMHTHCLTSDAAREILVGLHTMKGDALCLGLLHLTELIHKVEAHILEPSSFREGAHGKQAWLALIGTFKTYEEVSRIFFRADEGLGEMDLAKAEKPALEFFRDLLSIRNVEELLAGTGKRVQILVRDPEAEHFIASKSLWVLEAVLSHLIRNAIAHGIEDGATRILQGKSPIGTITISIRDDGIVLEDDGRGLDFEKIRAKALAMGAIKPGIKLDRDALAHLIFCPDLSTQDAPTLLSGRGIGMEAVALYLKEVGGSVELQLKDDDPAFGAFRVFVKLPQSIRTG